MANLTGERHEPIRNHWHHRAWSPAGLLIRRHDRMIIINGSDDEFDKPNAKPGYCPVCSQKMNIWDAKRNQFLCSFCNYAGIKTEPRPAYFNCKDSMRKHAND